METTAADASVGVFLKGMGNGDFKSTKPYDWAVEFDEKIKKFIKTGDHQSIIDYKKMFLL